MSEVAITKIGLLWTRLLSSIYFRLEDGARTTLNISLQRLQPVRCVEPRRQFKNHFMNIEDIQFV